MPPKSRRRSSVLTNDQQDRLENRIRSRPQVGSTFHKQLVSTGQDVAPSIHAAAKKLERNLIADNLNQQLYAREEPSNLQSGIFRGDNVAPRLRNAKIALERAISRDQVGHLLECRPEEEELLKTNVLRSGGGRRASRIQGVQKQLEHNMTVDKVGHLLEKRSELEDLQQANIITGASHVAPALHQPQRDLQMSLAKSNLYHALKHRPSIIELQERGVYVDDSDSEGDYDDEYDEEDYGYDQGYDEDYGQQYYEDDEVDDDYGEYQYEDAYQTQEAYEPSGSQRRSKNFHLTRILLKFVASMAEAGEISLAQKGFLKDLIVDQDKTILAVAETFDAENDLNDFKDSLVRLASRL